MSLLAMQPSDKLLSLIDGALRSLLLLPKLGLLMNTPPITVDNVLADITQPTFAGYALVALTPNAVRKDVNGNYIIGYNDALFQPSGPVAPAQVVTGVFMQTTITAVDYLVGTEFLDQPVTFASATDALQVTWDLYTRNLLTWGGICGVC